HAKDYDYILVDFDLPTNIPLELIIARLQNSKTIILKSVTTLSELEVAFGVMEQGSDGVAFSGTDIHEIIEVSNYLQKQESYKIELKPLVVSEVRHIGMGMRSCIDTTGLMTQDEGMLIGSTSQGGIFVCSETHFLPYMNLRPFRVNAGAIHSYVWMPNNAAEYLTDLSAGSQVLCVNTKGEVRTLTVGRIKTEMRPLLLIRGQAGGKEINVIVQDDWHIRIMGADGLPKNATLIQPGDELFAYVSEPGRHVGIKVNETILEK
ncbi:MAG: 3-dehydroquinate synthase II, partial [Bacillota bacterium]|nr:3-dehydroquinate synthase II [Bacillota bacterium]